MYATLSAGRSLLRLVAFALITFAGGAFAQSTFVGTVKTIEGSPLVIRAGKAMVATPGFHLEEKDTIRTDASSRLGFILRDGSRVAIGASTELSIEEFAFNPSSGQLQSLLRVLRGVAAFVSGKIAKLSPESSKVETPVAMIGLRGTTFAVSMEPQ